MAIGTATAVTALMVGGSAFSAVSSFTGGKQQAKAITQQAEHNAQIYEQQASMIEQKKKIQDTQYARQIARTRSSMVSKTAGKGLLLSGSPLAVMADTESQMLFDQAIAGYNLDVEKNFATSAAASTRFTGANEARVAKAQGFSNAFSTILNTGTNLAIRGGWGMPKAGRL